MKSLFKKICIGSDHAGFQLKEFVKDFLIKEKISITDLGPFTSNSVDYPDYAKKVSKRVQSKKSDVGILICGSGTGMAITANKTKGIRAAVCYNSRLTRLSREHNNANIISLGSRFVKKKDALKMVSIFLNTKLEGGRHQRSVKKI